MQKHKRSARLNNLRLTHTNVLQYYTGQDEKLLGTQQSVHDRANTTATVQLEQHKL